MMMYQIGSGDGLALNRRQAIAKPEMSEFMYARQQTLCADDINTRICLLI